MKKHTFCPSLTDVLEDRLVLSHAGAAGVVHINHAHPKPPNPGTPVLKTTTLNDMNRQVDRAFTQFNKSYTKEIARVDRTGDETKFLSDFNVSVNQLKLTLDKQAARIPGGTQKLAPVLNTTVDSLAKDLATKTSSSTDLIHADQSGAHADVSTYIHDAVSNGEFSVK
jgi:hypothetical protein